MTCKCNLSVNKPLGLCIPASTRLPPCAPALSTASSDLEDALLILREASCRVAGRPSGLVPPFVMSTSTSTVVVCLLKLLLLLFMTRLGGLNAWASLEGAPPIPSSCLGPLKGPPVISLKAWLLLVLLILWPLKGPSIPISLSKLSIVSVGVGVKDDVFTPVIHWWMLLVPIAALWSLLLKVRRLLRDGWIAGCCWPSVLSDSLPSSVRCGSQLMSSAGSTEKRVRILAIVAASCCCVIPAVLRSLVCRRTRVKDSCSSLVLQRSATPLALRMRSCCIASVSGGYV